MNVENPRTKRVLSNERAFDVPLLIFANINYHARRYNRCIKTRVAVAVARFTSLTMHVYGNDGRASIIVQTHSTMESQLPPWTIISYVRFITPIAFSTPRDLLLFFFFFFHRWFLVASFLFDVET